jgi:Leucine-rich repeat (LRR) protein
MALDGLIRLSVCGNRLERVDVAHAKWGRLEVLELAGNALTQVKSIEKLPSLRVLNLGKLYISVWSSDD